MLRLDPALDAPQALRHVSGDLDLATAPLLLSRDLDGTLIVHDPCWSLTRIRDIFDMTDTLDRRSPPRPRRPRRRRQTMRPHPGA